MRGAVARVATVMGGVLAMTLVAAVAAGSPAMASGAPPSTVPGHQVVRYPSGELPAGRVVPARDITALAMATAEVGYAVGGPRGSVYPLRTHDGGATWRVDGPALFLPIADAPDAVGSLAAEGPRVAVVWGGQAGGSTVDVTTDGGGHWWRASLGEALEAVGGPPSDLWALAAGSNRAGAPALWRYTSVDGGRTWRYGGTLPGVAGWDADLVRPSAAEGYALVTGFPDRRTSSRGTGLASTNDGGRRWHAADDPCNAAPGHPSQTLSASGRALWLLCGSAINGRGEQAKVLLRSMNGGRTWTTVSSHLPRAGVLPAAGATGRFVPSSPLGSLLVVGGRRPALLASSDGGARWASGGPAAVEAQGPMQVAAAGGTVVVLTRSAVWSERAGRWTQLP